MKSKKIMFYISSLAKAGAQRVIINLTESLLKKGHQVTIVTTAKAENEYELPKGAKRIISDIEEKEITSNRIKNLKKRFYKLRNIWKNEKPDVIVSFIGKNNFMAILTALGLKIPVVVSVRGEPMEEYYSSGLRFLAKYLFRKADGIILQTEDSKTFFPKKTTKKAVVLPNPLNPEFMKDLYEGEKEKKIVMVGRIDSNKNQKMVIDAFAPIAHKYPDYKLEIWGDGEDYDSLKDYISSIKLEKQISMPGATRDVKEKIEKAGVYILSSNTEGMPNSLMEAMALGLCCISTDCPCGGPKILIQDGVNGLLTPVKDVDAMTKAMDKVLGNPEYAAKLGKQAAEIRKTLSPKKVNEQWENYLVSKCR